MQKTRSVRLTIYITLIKGLLDLQLEHAIVWKYQAVSRRKSRGSKIWYYVLFIIVWRPPISFCGWIGDTFKINYKVRSQSLDFSLKIHGKYILSIEFNENPMIIDEYQPWKLSVVKKQTAHQQATVPYNLFWKYLQSTHKIVWVTPSIRH